jgi:hypothetical protein
MPPNKPTAKPRVPADAVEKLADKYAKRETGSDTASSQAHEAASSLAGGSSESRSGTLKAPHRRKTDNVATSSTTIHLPVDLHKRLRLAATTRGVHMSQIVAEAVADWLAAHNG